MYIFCLAEWIQQNIAINAVIAQSTTRYRSSNKRGCAKWLVQISSAVTRKLMVKALLSLSIILWRHAVRMCAKLHTCEVLAVGGSDGRLTLQPLNPKTKPSPYPFSQGVDEPCRWLHLTLCAPNWGTQNLIQEGVKRRLKSDNACYLSVQNLCLLVCRLKT
jgi:hypothetical protein